MSERAELKAYSQESLPATGYTGADFPIYKTDLSAFTKLWSKSSRGSGYPLNEAWYKVYILDPLDKNAWLPPAYSNAYSGTVLLSCNDANH